MRRIGIAILMWCRFLLGAQILSVQPLTAQTESRIADSLQTALSHAPNDTTRARLLNELAYALYDSYPQKTLAYALEARTLAARTGNKTQEAAAERNLGIYYRSQRRPDEALQHYRQARTLYEALGDKRGTARILNNLANVYADQANYSAALEHYFASLRLEEERGEKRNIARVLNNIGVLYKEQNHDSSALVYYRQSLAISQDMHDTNAIAVSLNSLGSVLKGQAQYSAALQHYTESLGFARKTADSALTASILSNMAQTLFHLNKPQASLLYGQEALILFAQLGDNDGIAATYCTLAQTLRQQGQTAQALEYAQKAYSAARTGSALVRLRDVSRTLAELYEDGHRFDSAVVYHRLYAALQDSIQNTTQNTHIAQLQAVYDAQNKDRRIRELNDQTLRQASDLRTEERIRVGLFVGILILFVLALALVNRYRFKQRVAADLTQRNNELQEANEEISRQQHVLAEQAMEIELTNSELNEINTQAATLNRQYEERVEELEAIDTIVRSLNRATDLHSMLHVLLEQGHKLLPAAEHSSVLVFDDALQKYRFIAFHNYEAAVFEHLHFSREEINTRYTERYQVEEGVYVITDYPQPISGEQFTTTPPECSLAITIGFGTMIEGIVFFDNYTTKEAFTKHDIEQCRRFREHIITAFAKANIIQSLHHSAIQLSERNEKLQRMDEEKNEFLGIAAHDLKNPLGNIMMNAGMIKRFHSRMNPEELETTADNIERIAKRMTEIITNLLSINALESGKVALQQTPIDVVFLLSSIVEEMRQQAEQKNLRIEFSSTTPQAFVLADSLALRSVLENLCSNAVKYSPPDKNIFVRILDQPNNQVTNQLSNHLLRIEIQDQGPGISEADMKKLFGKFTRLSARPTGGEHSTGLGLSIVKKLVEAMQGKVWCKSELHHGSTFIVELSAIEKTRLEKE